MKTLKNSNGQSNRRLCGGGTLFYITPRYVTGSQLSKKRLVTRPAANLSHNSIMQNSRPRTACGCMAFRLAVCSNVAVDPGCAAVAWFLGNGYIF